MSAFSRLPNRLAIFPTVRPIYFPGPPVIRLVPSLTNQVFADIIVGIEALTEPAGYHLMLSHYGYSPELEERSLASLLSYNVDGVILSDRDHTPRSLRMLETAGIPIVEIMDTHRPPLQQTVGYDNVQAAYDMVSEMIRRGRRQVIYLAVRLDERTRQRELGYRRAMEEHGAWAHGLGGLSWPRCGPCDDTTLGQRGDTASGHRRSSSGAAVSAYSR